MFQFAVAVVYQCRTITLISAGQFMQLANFLNLNSSVFNRHFQFAIEFSDQCACAMIANVLIRIGSVLALIEQSTQ